MTRGVPVTNSTVVSDGGGPEVSSTIAAASGTIRAADGSALVRVAARPPHAATARQSQLARLQRLPDIPVIDPLPA